MAHILFLLDITIGFYLPSPHCLSPSLLHVPTTAQVPSMLATSPVPHASPHSSPHLQGRLAETGVIPLGQLRKRRNSIRAMQVENWNSDLVKRPFLSPF